MPRPGGGGVGSLSFRGLGPRLVRLQRSMFVAYTPITARTGKERAAVASPGFPSSPELILIGGPFSIYNTLVPVPVGVSALLMVSICTAGPQSTQLFLVPPVYLLRFSLPPAHKADLFSQSSQPVLDRHLL